MTRLFDGIQLSGTPRIHVCEPGWRWSPPPLPDYDLWCVLDGEGELRVEGHVFPLVSNRCFVLPPGATPRASQNPARRLHVLYAHFRLPGMEEPLPPLLGITVRRDPAALLTLCLRLASVGGRGTAHSGQTETLLQCLLWLLLDEQNAPDESPADTAVRVVAARIQAAPGDEWPVERQAERAGLSRSQYGRRFFALFACSPVDWVIEARLTRAAQLLLETTMPIGQIAQVLGYRDVFYFSRQFKQKKGVAPSVLRAK